MNGPSGVEIAAEGTTAAGSAPPRPRVVTIVLNTNRRDDTLECLASLATQTIARQNHVVVLDNRSVDGSVEAIRRDFPGTEIIALDADGGYAGNNNVGVRAACARGADWVFILNEDTVLDPGCLEEMVAAGERDPAVGIVGPMVYHHDEPTIIQSAGGRITPSFDAVHIGENEADRGQYDTPREVEWVSGCALLIRRALVEQAGMLDERFYYYWEETEWCIRSRKAGWRILHLPAARLWHKGVRRDYRPNANVTYYNTRNRLLLLSIHRPGGWIRLVALAQSLRTLVSWTIRPKWKDQKAHRDALWQGLMDFMRGRWGRRRA
jgi:GT2 family glycosyltransferase